MAKKLYSIEEIKALVIPVAKKYGVVRVLLFGSYARGEQTPESDLDFLIDEGNICSLIQLSEFRIELEDTFRKEIDIVTMTSLTEDIEFKENIEKDALLLYVKR